MGGRCRAGLVDTLYCNEMPLLYVCMLPAMRLILMLEFYTLVDHIISLTLPVGNHQSSLGVRSSRLVRLVLGLLLFTKKKTSVSLVAVHDVTIRITKQTAGYVLLSSRIQHNALIGQKSSRGRVIGNSRILLQRAKTRGALRFRVITGTLRPPTSCSAGGSFMASPPPHHGYLADCLTGLGKALSLLIFARTYSYLCRSTLTLSVSGSFPATEILASRPCLAPSHEK